MSVHLEIREERRRQDLKWGEQNHPDGTGKDVEPVPMWSAEDLADFCKNETDVMAQAGLVSWRNILMEEVTEAFVESDPDKLRAELVQVAAVAAQWVEAIDRRREPEVPC